MRHCKGQNILEYAVLICVVISALLIMQVYVKRSYQGRLKQEADSLGQQYSPKHTSSLAVTNTEIKSESYTGGQTQVSDVVDKAVTVPEGMSVSFSKTNTTFERKEAVDSYASED